MHRFFWFRRQYEQYRQFIDVDKTKQIVKMKNIVRVVRVVFPKSYQHNMSCFLNLTQNTQNTQIFLV